MPVSSQYPSVLVVVGKATCGMNQVTGATPMNVALIQSTHPVELVSTAAPTTTSIDDVVRIALARDSNGLMTTTQHSTRTDKRRESSHQPVVEDTKTKNYPNPCETTNNDDTTSSSNNKLLKVVEQTQEQQQKLQQQDRDNKSLVRMLTSPPHAPVTYQEMSAHLLTLSSSALPSKPHKARHSDRVPARQNKVLRTGSYRGARSASPSTLTICNMSAEEAVKKAYLRQQQEQEEEEEESPTYSGDENHDKEYKKSTNHSTKQAQQQEGTVSKNSQRPRQRIFVRSGSLPCLCLAEFANESDDDDNDDLLLGTFSSTTPTCSVFDDGDDALTSASSPTTTTTGATTTTTATFSTPRRHMIRRRRSGSYAEDIMSAANNKLRPLAAAAATTTEVQRGVEAHFSGSSAGSSVIRQLLRSDAKEDDEGTRTARTATTGYDTSMSVSSFTDDYDDEKKVSLDLSSPPRLKSERTPSHLFFDDDDGSLASLVARKQQKEGRQTNNNDDDDDKIDDCIKASPISPKRKVPSILQVCSMFTTSLPSTSKTSLSKQSRNTKKHKKVKKSNSSGSKSSAEENSSSSSTVETTECITKSDEGDVKKKDSKTTTSTTLETKVTEEVKSKNEIEMALSAGKFIDTGTHKRRALKVSSVDNSKSSGDGGTNKRKDSNASSADSISREPKSKDETIELTVSANNRPSDGGGTYKRKDSKASSVESKSSKDDEMTDATGSTNKSSDGGKHNRKDFKAAASSSVDSKSNNEPTKRKAETVSTSKSKDVGMQKWRGSKTSFVVDSDTVDSGNNKSMEGGRKKQTKVTAVDKNAHEPGKEENGVNALIKTIDSGRKKDGKVSGDNNKRCDEHKMENIDLSTLSGKAIDGGKKKDMKVPADKRGGLEPKKEEETEDDKSPSSKCSDGGKKKDFKLPADKKPLESKQHEQRKELNNVTNKSSDDGKKDVVLPPLGSSTEHHRMNKKGRGELSSARTKNFRKSISSSHLLDRMQSSERKESLLKMKRRNSRGDQSFESRDGLRVVRTEQTNKASRHDEDMKQDKNKPNGENNGRSSTETVHDSKKVIRKGIEQSIHSKKTTRRKSVSAEHLEYPKEEGVPKPGNTSGKGKSGLHKLIDKSRPKHVSSAKKLSSNASAPGSFPREKKQKKQVTVEKKRQHNATWDELHDLMDLFQKTDSAIGSSSKDLSVESTTADVKTRRNSIGNVSSSNWRADGRHSPRSMPRSNRSVTLVSIRGVVDAVNGASSVTHENGSIERLYSLSSPDLVYSPGRPPSHLSGQIDGGKAKSSKRGTAAMHRGSSMRLLSSHPDSPLPPKGKREVYCSPRVRYPKTDLKETIEPTSWPRVQKQKVATRSIPHRLPLS